MDIFVSKLRSTVSTTVSNINTILPGNPVTRDYEVTGHKASGGPGHLWKIYSGLKKSTKEEASVFVLEKRKLDKFAKRDRELILDIIRKGVSQLTKLKHPSILTVQHPLEESRDSLAFATEPVFASLSNLLGSCENIENVSQEIISFEFYDIEIKYGLLQISEALAFLHSDAKILHRNICPEVIMISKKGSWKLAGFDFATQAVNPNDFPLKFPTLNVSNLTSDFPVLALPNLDYVAPEYLNQSSISESFLLAASDMFSLGCLTCTIFNKGKPLLPTGGSVSQMNPSRIDQFERLPSEAFSSLPEEIKYNIKTLLSSNPSDRPDAHKFSKLEIFEDIMVRSLQYLDSLFQFENLEKSKFYRGLSDVMAAMPKRIKLDRVFFCLANEFVNPDMVPFVLPNVFIISKELSSKEFVEIILPSLIPVFQMREPVQISMIFMENMELLLRKCKSNQDSIKSYILPMLCSTLESENQAVSELCLKTLPTIAHLIDAPSMKNAVIPRIKKLCLETNNLSTRVNCLLCIAKLLPFLDKWLVIDDLISFFPSIKSKEPAVIMAIVGIYKLVMNSDKLGLTKEVMANKAIPFLVPLSIENGLTASQFSSIMSIVREMINLIEKDHKVKLEKLDDIRSQQQGALVKCQTNDVTSWDVFSNKQIEPSREMKAVEFPMTALSPVQINNSPPKTSPVTPKDLSSSLIASNIRQFSSPNTTPNGSKNFSKSQNTSPTINFNTYSGISPINTSPFNAFSGINTMNGQMSCPFSSSPLGLKTRPQLNLTALDNLDIPELNKASKGPMMKMMSTSSGSQNLSFQNNNKKISKLSESDIKDFLS